MNLFIDTTNWKIIYILEQENVVLDFWVLNDVVKSSDVVIESLQKFLEKKLLTLQKIDNFYLTTGPGGYTGIRVGMTIVKTIKTIHPETGVYLINSLLYQVGLEQGVSLLDARGQKVYCAVYNQGKTVVSEQLLLANEVEQKFQKYLSAGYKIYQDYKKLDYVKNYLALKNQFKLVTNVEAIEPVYIKNFV